VIAVLGGLRIRDAGVGRYDTVPIQTALRSELRSEGVPDGGGGGDGLGYLETLQRVWLVPTMRRLLAAWAVLGIVVTPLPTYLGFLLEDRWGLTTAGRAIFLAGTWACTLPALAFFAGRGDARLHSGPARLVSVAPAILVAMAVGLLLGAVAPTLPVAFVGFGIALAMSGVLVPVLAVTTMSVVEPRARPHAMALAAVFQLGVGGLGGAELLGGLNNRFGNGLAIGILAIPALVAALLVRRAAVTADADMYRVVGDVVEQEEVAAIVHHGHHLPLLACRHIDFAYGQLQVLFDVNLTVDEGEIVALLGTNGAGKSTLLRAISGLGFPQSGTVRLEGHDITFFGPDRRVKLGISQIPGGRAVFGPMTVAENLRVFGTSLGRDSNRARLGVDAVFEAFPILGERRNQRASSLSGGEQQMLGLGKAYLTMPKLLLIDELSLGLAPMVTAELVESVKRLNAQGIAVVLVEQSVNVALSLVNHAYFMEKGEIRFDGRATDLIDRPDLLRSIFLEGASDRLSATVTSDGHRPPTAHPPPGGGG
jgi:ABC-type branched-subunit amino acid transport system ATPase component